MEYDVENKHIAQDMSGSVGKIAEAMSVVQGMITGAVKGSKNPFFKSDYADLASVIDCSREALSKNKIAVFQTFVESDDTIRMKTMLIHSSGEFISSTLTMRPMKPDAQAAGSLITYMRRYSLAAMVGIAQIDSDAEDAMNRGEIQGVSVDMAEVNRVATKIVKMIQDEDPSSPPYKEAKEIYQPLSNDFRMALQPILKGRKFGKRTAWSVYRELLSYKEENT